MLKSLIDIAYLIAAILFIYGLKRLQSPATARNGNRLAAVGMAEYHPLDPADNPEAYRRNRRIELKITSR